MFERITITETENADPDRPLDVGLILESMLFYKKTIVMISTQKSFFQLLHELGDRNLLKLIESDTLELMFNESYTAIKSDPDSNNRIYHNIVTFSNNSITKESELQKACVKYTGREGRGRRLSNVLADKTKSFKHQRNFDQISKEVFLDKKYIQKTYRMILENHVPGQKDWDNTIFEVESQKNGFYINTTLNFDKLNNEIALLGKEKIILRPANILANILEIENDVYRTSYNTSELVSHSTKNNLLSLRLQYFMEKLKNNIQAKENLLKHINLNFRTLREEYNLKKIDVNKIVAAILHSNKFKNWLNSKDNDENILNAYLSEISKIDNFSSLPNKSFRWIIFTLTGIAFETFLPTGIGTTLTLTSGVLDTFFLEKLISGWRPNQFVNTYLTSAIKK